MALVRSLWNQNYWAHFSTLVVRDGLAGDDADDEPVPAALNEYEIDGLCGTAGRAGVGWFLAPSGDGQHRVGLEVHDTPPGPPGDRWSRVLETPYRSPTGTVGLTNVTDGPARPGPANRRPARSRPLPPAGEQPAGRRRLGLAAVLVAERS